MAHFRLELSTMTEMGCEDGFAPQGYRKLACVQIIVQAELTLEIDIPSNTTRDFSVLIRHVYMRARRRAQHLVLAFAPACNPMLTHGTVTDDNPPTNEAIPLYESLFPWPF
jgi:hypothetical protein